MCGSRGAWCGHPRGRLKNGNVVKEPRKSVNDKREGVESRIQFLSKTLVFFGDEETSMRATVRDGAESLAHGLLG